MRTITVQAQQRVCVHVHRFQAVSRLFHGHRQRYAWERQKRQQLREMSEKRHNRRTGRQRDAHIGGCEWEKTDRVKDNK